MRRLAGILLLLLGLLTACGGETVDGDLVFVNGTDTPVYRVAVEWSGGAEVGMNADESPMERDDCIAFQLEGYPVKVTAFGADGAELAGAVIHRPGPWIVQLAFDAAGDYAIKVDMTKTAAG